MPRALLALLMLGIAGFAWSQSDAAALLSEARDAARQARSIYDIHTPDQPLWREALELSARARRLEPENLDIARFQALVHSEVNWHVRAHELWLEYLEAGGTLDPLPADEGMPVAEAFAEAGNQLGFARYQGGNLAAAVGYYQTVVRHLPEEPEALYWLGRLNLELGEEEAARSYFERLLEVDPEHQTGRYYLGLVDERLLVGEDASQAYRQGLSAYEEGRLAEAYDYFARAVRINPRFADAASWAGRTALELGQPTTAADHWEQVLALRPNDEAADYFLEVSNTQALWGVEAGRAYFEGQAAYSRGEMEAAARAFARAVDANPQMVEAWEWAARASQEAGAAEDAVRYWQGVLERRPGDEGARYSLEVARQQVRFGARAGLAFAQAVRHYQLAEFDAAESAFRRAVEENPQFATAWGWLGRLYFTRANYDEAAEAYSRAYELEPTNDDYAFFAEEAERLAAESLNETAGGGG